MNCFTPLRILLADDDYNDTFLFREALAQTPIHTDLATTPEGLEQFLITI